MAPRALALLLIAALAPPAAAQGEIRSVVVPAEGAVVIPPRSAPRLAARPAGTGAGIPIPPGPASGTSSGTSSGPVLLSGEGAMGLAAPALGFALPALAGALLGGSLAGSKGGTSAPTRTR